MKEINTQHNTQDPTQTRQPKANSSSLLWPWSDHILLLFPHLHWEDKTHTKLIVSPQTGDWAIDFFLSLFKKQERFGPGRFVFLFSRYPKAFSLSTDAVICLTTYLMLGQAQKRDMISTIVPGENTKLWSNPAIFRDWFLCRDPPFSPGFWCWSLTTPDRRVQSHGFF